MHVKNSYNSTIKRQIIQFKNGQRFQLLFSPRWYKRGKNAQSWLREKYTTRYHFTYTRMSMIKNKKRQVLLRM